MTFPEEYGVGFKKGNTELRDKVQAALEDKAKDGTMKESLKSGFAKTLLPLENNKCFKSETDIMNIFPADLDEKIAVDNCAPVLR